LHCNREPYGQTCILILNRIWRLVVKALLVVLGSLVGVVGAFLACVYVAALMIAEPAPHQFAHLDTPDLWTSSPVRVDSSQQAYERIPGLAIVASVPASDLPTSLTSTDTAQASENTDTSLAADQAGGPELADAGQSGPAVDAAQAEWCLARYRSYRVEDNSYQPFSGPRRTCESPVSRIQQSASNLAVAPGHPADLTHGAVQPVSQTADASQGMQMTGQSRSHAEWCLSRYRSYRLDDNSYQPFDGSARRSCQSPFG
jgi:hypothetical protein